VQMSRICAGWQASGKQLTTWAIPKREEIEDYQISNPNCGVAIRFSLDQLASLYAYEKASLGVLSAVRLLYPSTYLT
jgi:hypothetical protein